MLETVIQQFISVCVCVGVLMSKVNFLLESYLLN